MLNSNLPHFVSFFFYPSTKNDKVFKILRCLPCSQTKYVFKSSASSWKQNDKPSVIRMLNIVWSTPSKSFGCPPHHGPSNTAPEDQRQPCSVADPGTCSIPIVTTCSSFEPYFTTACSNMGWTSLVVFGLKIL